MPTGRDIVPKILEEAWSMCTPADRPLSEQIVPLERTFLIKFAKYLTEVYPNREENLTFLEKEKLIADILATASSRFAVLVKEVTPSITHAVVAVVLYLLSNIFTNDHVKYKTQEDMLAAYPTFTDRSETDKQNLFLTANWMNILFRMIPARKNKGIAMDIIPKFVEGNGAHYVTGGGQTRATRDRVFIYETEGGCKPIKRLKRKSKSKLLEEEAESDAFEKQGDSSENPNKKMAVAFPSEGTRGLSDASAKDHYFQLPAPFYHAQPLPIPVISPRSQSSFTQAAAVIANFGQLQPGLTSVPSQSTDGNTSSEDLKESDTSSNANSRECYIDIDENGNVVRKLSPRSFAAKQEVSNSDTVTPPSLGSGVSITSMPSRISSTTSTFDKFVDNLSNVDVEVVGDQLAMLREASADSDI